MKFAKKLISILLVVLMLTTMAVPALADTPITITIENTVPGHTYEAYQIFKGTLHEGILTAIDWGTGVDGVALLAELNKSTGTGYPLFKKNETNLFGSVGDANGVAGVIAGWPYNEADIRKFADVASRFLATTATGTATVAEGATKCTIDVTSAGTGYYLIKDVSVNPGVEGATDYLLQVVGPTNVAVKTSKPTFTKSVNSTKEGTYTKEIDSEVSDLTITGDMLATSNVVWFKLEATLPSLFNYYNQYYLKFEDIVPVGLEPVSGSSNGNIYIQHESGSKTVLISEQTSVQPQADGTSKITLDLGNIKTQLSGVTLNLNDTIVIKYAARIKSGATLSGGEKVYTVLGNGAGSKPGNTNTAKMIFSADMNETKSSGYKTAEIEDHAHVFTYQATFTKVDSATKIPLAGAEFVLFRNRTISDALVPYYAIIDGDGWISDWTTDIEEATRLVSSAVTKVEDAYQGGSFTVKGLDSLSYHLKEVVPPGGYELMQEPVLFTINKEFNTTTHALTSVSMVLDGSTSVGDIATGLVAGSINNTKGNVLPATGGMGTTIFYAAGAVLLLGSVAAFAVKKRNEE